MSFRINYQLIRRSFLLLALLFTAWLSQGVCCTEECGTGAEESNLCTLVATGGPDNTLLLGLSLEPGETRQVFDGMVPDNASMFKLGSTSPSYECMARLYEPGTEETPGALIDEAKTEGGTEDWLWLELFAEALGKRVIATCQLDPGLSEGEGTSIEAAFVRKMDPATTTVLGDEYQILDNGASGDVETAVSNVPDPNPYPPGTDDYYLWLAFNDDAAAEACGLPSAPAGSPCSTAFRGVISYFIQGSGQDESGEGVIRDVYDAIKNTKFIVAGPPVVNGAGNASAQIVDEAVQQICSEARAYQAATGQRAWVDTGGFSRGAIIAYAIMRNIINDGYCEGAARPRFVFVHDPVSGFIADDLSLEVRSEEDKNNGVIEPALAHTHTVVATRTLNQQEANAFAYPNHPIHADTPLGPYDMPHSDLGNSDEVTRIYLSMLASWEEFIDIANGPEGSPGEGTNPDGSTGEPGNPGDLGGGNSGGGGAGNTWEENDNVIVLED